MKEILRVSAVTVKGTPLNTEKRDNWDIVMEYAGEGEGPYLVDLSHKPRFDLQDADIGSITPFGIAVPESPGKSVLQDGLLINRMNGTQVSIYNLAGQGNVSMPDETGYTDVTESTICVAILGKQVFSICEKLTSLDFMNPENVAPFLFQGPFSHVPCQIVTLNKTGDDAGVILTCSRGYGRDMTHSILDAGDEFTVKPAGENRFADWISRL